MTRCAYRGVSFSEAKMVVDRQKYERNELRAFQNGIAARSSFGDGVYLINDKELAAQYAFCHAEVEDKELAAVLSQKICFKNPFILNYQFTEPRLRKEALRWKYKGKDFPNKEELNNPKELYEQIGNDIKEYLLYHLYDGIIYHVDEEIIYYVLYDQENQIKDIDMELIFNIKGSKKLPFYF
ncbi:hypothetical protein F7731_00100 [Cytobacillus depressus]|uniref:Uncharacterized protein n=1 Tax=Cytobacillus depressus TaxID=1602942 RepID=A0A6L3VA37_9BACI|nr:hypothetical protein [Cytobacillus depressus]KAB2338022.1 hypothetical protein F7731_00100 [Cytobacillus depressus]